MSDENRKSYELTTLKGLKLLRAKAPGIAMRIKRDKKWYSLWIPEMTPLELLDTMIMWVESGRKISE